MYLLKTEIKKKKTSQLNLNAYIAPQHQKKTRKNKTKFLHSENIYLAEVY